MGEGIDSECSKSAGPLGCSILPRSMLELEDYIFFDEEAFALLDSALAGWTNDLELHVYILYNSIYIYIHTINIQVCTLYNGAAELCH